MSTPKQKYRLDISIRLAPVNETGYPTSSAIEIREDEIVEAETFLEVASILGKFHELAQTMRS